MALHFVLEIILEKIYLKKFDVDGTYKQVHLDLVSTLQTIFTQGDRILGNSHTLWKKSQRSNFGALFQKYWRLLSTRIWWPNTGRALEVQHGGSRHHMWKTNKGATTTFHFPKLRSPSSHQTTAWGSLLTYKLMNLWERFTTRRQWTCTRRSKILSYCSTVWNFLQIWSWHKAFGLGEGVCNFY